LQERELITGVRKLLDSDEYLFEVAIRKLAESQRLINNIARAVHLLHVCRPHVLNAQSAPRSDLFVKALAGQLVNAPILREILLAVKKSASDLLLKVLTDLVPLLGEEDEGTVSRILDGLQTLLSQKDGKDEPLRSEHDIRNETLRTTVVANKVLLSKHKSNLSEKDVAYSKLVNEFHDWLKTHLEEHLQDPETFFMHEVLIYDLRGPHRSALIPKTRHAVERALFCPHDYLGCTCCVSNNQDVDGEVFTALSSICIF
jgi:origin recognition complex subunit 3